MNSFLNTRFFTSYLSIQNNQIDCNVEIYCITMFLALVWYLTVGKYKYEDTIFKTSSSRHSHCIDMTRNGRHVNYPPLNPKNNGVTLNLETRNNSHVHIILSQASRCECPRPHKKWHLNKSIKTWRGGELFLSVSPFIWFPPLVWRRLYLCFDSVWSGLRWFVTRNIFN